MTDNSNKIIAKNTLLLYIRMLFMMAIGLFTSRVILTALGISDMGLMSVAGSVITMFTFLNATLTSGTQRFISYAIGENNAQRLRAVFKSAMTLHLLLAIIIFFLGETLGLWYVYNKLNVEPGRFQAAMWCYQLSIISTVVGMVQLPFNSALIAHEKMNIYAYMTIFDAVFKLLAAYLIQIVCFDRLIFYSILIFAAELLSTFLYNLYCRKHFKECSFSFGYDKGIFRNMLSFSGWNTLGCLAAMGQGTGVNLIINSFCGTVVNGARGIAFQANGWVTRFVENFMVALNPQIIKSYASGDIQMMSSLVINGARFGCYLFLLLGIPLFVEIEFVLKLWLGQCPEHTVAFMRIVMIETLFKTMGTPTVTAMHATGQMKLLNITVGSILLLIVPVSYVCFRLGLSPEQVLLINIIPWIVVPFIRVFLVKKYSQGKFPVGQYLYQVVLKTTAMALLMFVPIWLFSYYMQSYTDWIRFCAIFTSSLVFSAMVIYYIGLEQKYRILLVEKLKVKIGYEEK
jgi:Na+-driven multidrug efflux pump